MVRITPIYRPFRPFGRGPITLLRGPTITMVINHLRPSWDDPPTRKDDWMVFAAGWFDHPRNGTFFFVLERDS